MNLFKRLFQNKPSLKQYEQYAASQASFIPRIHTHPDLERRLGLDAEHVIIDKDAFQWLVANSGAHINVYKHPFYTPTKREQLAEGIERRTKDYNHNLKLLFRTPRL